MATTFQRFAVLVQRNWRSRVATAIAKQGRVVSRSGCCPRPAGVTVSTAVETDMNVWSEAAAWHRLQVRRRTKDGCPVERQEARTDSHTESPVQQVLLHATQAERQRVLHQPLTATANAAAAQYGLSLPDTCRRAVLEEPSDAQKAQVRVPV